MPASKTVLIQSRLGGRVQELGLRSIDEYCALIFSAAGAGAERAHLVNAVTTNKTDFFREAQQLEYLTQTILPELERLRRTTSVWSAACSSGEEAYTLSMLLTDYGLGRPSFSFRILATDVSTKVLDMARMGVYNKPQIEPIPPDFRRKYLVPGPKANQSRIAPAARRFLTFQALNFMDAQYAVREMYDVIFCRNVLIYFDRSTQEAVINKLCRHLSPGGYLFAGLAESLSGMKVPLVALGASCHRKPG